VDQLNQLVALRNQGKLLFGVRSRFFQQDVVTYQPVPELEETPQEPCQSGIQMILDAELILLNELRH